MVIFKNQVRYLVHFTAPTVSVFDCYRLKQTGGTQHVRGGGVLLAKGQGDPKMKI